MSLTPQSLKRGERYNWKNQPERLVYIGTARYPGDYRVWFQFAKVESPDVCWSEVLATDLESIEPTGAEQ